MVSCDSSVRSSPDATFKSILIESIDGRALDRDQTQTAVFVSVERVLFARCDKWILNFDWCRRRTNGANAMEITGVAAMLFGVRICRHMFDRNAQANELSSNCWCFAFSGIGLSHLNCNVSIVLHRVRFMLFEFDSLFDNDRTKCVALVMTRRKKSRAFRIDFPFWFCRCGRAATSRRQIVVPCARYRAKQPPSNTIQLYVNMADDVFWFFRCVCFFVFMSPLVHVRLCLCFSLFLVSFDVKMTIGVEGDTKMKKTKKQKHECAFVVTCDWRISIESIQSSPHFCRGLFSLYLFRKIAWLVIQ